MPNTAASRVEANSSEANRSELPIALPLELLVRDPDTIAELYAYPEGDDRDQFALNALRIGVLALKQARGQIDADAVRRESERLMDSLQTRLDEHSRLVRERLAVALKHYFDPEEGRFHERVDRLIRKDGELENLLRRQIGNEDSELCKTLTAHFGEESQLMKLLSPDQSKGLLAALRETLDEQLKLQREHVLSQFSLDNKQGALSRFIVELTDRQGELSTELHGKLDGVVKQFSLDDEESALSRLVKNVERAQRTITSEFSLDSDDSSLARLKRELLKLLSEERDANRKFQEEVKGALQAMVARREEAERSTRHGLDFEEAVIEFMQYECQKVGDIATPSGHTTGRIKNCKVGDCVVELGPESAAPGSCVVIEAKEQAGYGLAQARDEIEKARKNRDAQVGLFVFSSATAPAGLQPVARYGHDVFVTWNAEDTQTDLYLSVGLNLARALCVRARRQQDAQQADFTEIDKAILEVEKRAGNLDEIDKWTTTIRNNCDRILKQTRVMRKSLVRQVRVLQEKTAALKDTMAADADAGH